jgi:3-oxoacyl-[acyl-carrier-protein] synthase-3
VNWEDRTTCVLFGDGAGAVVLGPADPSSDADPARPRGILSTQILTDGAFASSLIIPAGGSVLPLTHQVIDEKKHKVHMKGQDIFKMAVKYLFSASKKALDDAGMHGGDVDWLCAHQANLRIIDQVVARLGVPPDKVLMNIDRVGNTSSASIPILLDENMRAGKVKPGDTVLMCALGAGISWGSALVRI